MEGREWRKNKYLATSLDAKKTPNASAYLPIGEFRKS